MEAAGTAQRENVALLTSVVPQLREENSRAREIIGKMEEELSSVRSSGSSTALQLEEQLQLLRAEMQHLNAESLALKQELALRVQVRAQGCPRLSGALTCLHRPACTQLRLSHACVLGCPHAASSSATPHSHQVRTSTHSKLEEARKRLGLTASEAQVFVKEFDEAVKANALLRKEVAQLQADRSQLQQQCENRSQHCMTLIAENKRLVDQVGRAGEGRQGKEAEGRGGRCEGG